MSLRECIEKLIHRQNLERETCRQAFIEMLKPESNPLQIAAFLVLLRAKSATTEELDSFLSVLREKMIPVPTPHRVLDIVGTGGDHSNSINISTGSAILAASCGIKIAKNGNRGISSLTGAADVLEALGIKIDLSPEKVAACIDQVGIGFCFFPNFHPAAVGLRALGKQLQISTALNFLGPLLNPASPSHYLLGVFDDTLMPVIAKLLQQAGTQHSMVVHGHGLDELSCIGKARFLEVRPTGLTDVLLDPEVLGLPLCPQSALTGGKPEHNAKILVEAFSGKAGPVADTLILNTAAALYLYGHYPSIAEGIKHAKDNLYSEAPLTLLKKWGECSHD